MAGYGTENNLFNYGTILMDQVDATYDTAFSSIGIESYVNPTVFFNTGTDPSAGGTDDDEGNSNVHNLFSAELEATYDHNQTLGHDFFKAIVNSEHETSRYCLQDRFSLMPFGNDPGKGKE